MKLILDVDTGIDDTLAIAYICAQPDVELLAVTNVFGNVDVQQATRNSKFLLESLGANHVPVYSGSEYASHLNSYEQLRGGNVFHGDNGIGNVQIDTEIGSVNEGAHAALIELASRYPQEITIIATGPLTNLSEAITINPEAMKKVKRIVLMGGALSVPGNVSPFSEANIAQDSLAAKIVFESGIPITMIGLDVTSRAIITRDDLATWHTQSTLSKLLVDIQDHYFKAHELIYPSWNGAAMHDALAAVVAIHPGIVETHALPITVRTDDVQNGRTILDLDRVSDRLHHTVDVALIVDAKAFKDALLSSISSIL